MHERNHRLLGPKTHHGHRFQMVVKQEIRGRKIHESGGGKLDDTILQRKMVLFGAQNVVDIG